MKHRSLRTDAALLLAGLLLLAEGCGSKGGKASKKAYVQTLTDTSVYELQYSLPESFGKVELLYPSRYSQISEELSQKTDGTEISKIMTYNQYNGENGYFLSVQARRNTTMEWGQEEFIGPVSERDYTIETYGDVSFRRAFFEGSGNYVAWGERGGTFYLLKSQDKQILDDLLVSLSFTESAEPEVIDTSMYDMQYTVPQGREKVSYELHDIIGRGISYKRLSWSGDLYTDITVEPDMNLEYRLNDFVDYQDVTVNGQAFKTDVPAGSARQQHYITQYGDNVYQINFAYGDKSDDQAFLDSVKFS